MLVNYNDRETKYTISNSDKNTLKEFEILKKDNGKLTARDFFQGKEFENPYIKTYLTDPSKAKGSFEEYVSKYAQRTSSFQGKNAFIVDDNAKNILSKFNKENTTENFSVSKFIDNNQIKNKQLSSYLATNPQTENIIDGYTKYLESTNNVGKAYDSAAFKAKAFNVAANMALNVGGILAVSAAISLIGKAWDEVNVTVAEQKEKVEGLNGSITTLEAEYQSLSSKEAKLLTASDKDRLSYLEKRIILEKELLDIETRKMHQNVIGTSFTDLFDKDSLAQKSFLKDMNHTPMKDGLLSSYRIRQYNNAKNAVSSLTPAYEEAINSPEEPAQSTYLKPNGQANQGFSYAPALQSQSNAAASSNYNDAVENEVDTYTKLLNQYDELMLKKEEYNLNRQNAQDAIDSELLTGSSLQIAKDQVVEWETEIAKIEQMMTQISENMSLPQSFLESLDDRLSNITQEELENKFDHEDLRLLYSGEVEFDEDASVEELQDLINKLKGEDGEIPITFVQKNDFSDSISGITDFKNHLTSLAETYQDFTNSKKALSFDSLQELVNTFSDVEGMNLDGVLDTLSDSSSSTEEMEAAFDSLTKQYLYNSNVLGGLTKENADYVAQELTAIGVTDAAALTKRHLWYSVNRGDHR